MYIKSASLQKKHISGHHTHTCVHTEADATAPGQRGPNSVVWAGPRELAFSSSSFPAFWDTEVFYRPHTLRHCPHSLSWPRGPYSTFGTGVVLIRSTVKWADERDKWQRFHGHLAYTATTRKGVSSCRQCRTGKLHLRFQSPLLRNTGLSPG